MKTIAMILAGGEGRRLYPLTSGRCKPAVSFGGRYRIIDFTLSNLVNSGITRIKVLTQFKADSLIRHIQRGWQLSNLLDQYIDPVPAQMKKGPEWYRGTADAIYQNIDFIEREKPDCVAIFGGDHIYKMDIGQLTAFHAQKDADLTVSAIAHDINSAGSFGVLAVDENNRITNFVEKPKNPAPLPGRPDKSFVSMGIYLFKAEVICEILEKDATTDSDHDFGKDIITELIKHKKVFAYDFADNEIPGMEEKERGYWRDIGSIDQYWQSSMDLVSVSPIFNLYNRQWPIKCYYPPCPPAKFVFADIDSRAGIATDSLVAEGCIISGGRIDRSILSPHCRIHSYCHVSESVLMEGVVIGRNASVKKTIIDKNVVVPEGEKIGYDLDKERKRFTVTDNGVVVIAKNSKIQKTS